jgi:hypothetical protein
MKFQVTEKNPFKFEMTGTLDFQLTETDLTISFKVGKLNQSGELEGESEGGANLAIPVGFFGNPPERIKYIMEFIARVRFSILHHTSLRAALIQEAAFHFDDTLKLAVHDLGHEEWPDEEIIKAHIERTAARLKESIPSDEAPKYPKRGKGQPSKWSKLKLYHAVSTALRAIPDTNIKDSVLLESVAEKIKVAYPDIAPKSGESLRKLMERLEVDWRQLKLESNGPLVND